MKFGNGIRMSKQKVNLGCGSKILHEWFNLDFPGNKNPNVFTCDITKRWPFKDNSVQAFYSCHVFEHLAFELVTSICQKIHKSLISKGIIRITVPDLEFNCKLYLSTLKKYRKSKKNKSNLVWARLNLFEQMVRTKKGGFMLKFLSSCNQRNLDFVSKTTGGPEALQRNTIERNENPRTIRSYLEKIFPFDSLDVFPEIHRWCYDEFELRDILNSAGFKRIQRKNAGDSGIPGWIEPGIELTQDGGEWKPNSLIMEASKA